MTTDEIPPRNRPTDPPDLRVIRARMQEIWTRLDALLAARKALEQPPPA